MLECRSEDIETISDAANTLDHLLAVSVQPEFVVKPANEDVEIPQFATILVTPDAVQQVGVGEHLAVMLSQFLEKIELRWRQFDFFSGNGHPSGREVNLQVTAHERGRGRYWKRHPASPEHCLHSGNEFTCRKWLRYVVVGACLKSRDLVVVMDFRGDEDDGHGGEAADVSA